MHHRSEARHVAWSPGFWVLALLVQLGGCGLSSVALTSDQLDELETALHKAYRPSVVGAELLVSFDGPSVDDPLAGFRRAVLVDETLALLGDHSAVARYVVTFEQRLEGVIVHARTAYRASLGEPRAPSLPDAPPAAPARRWHDDPQLQLALAEAVALQGVTLAEQLPPGRGGGGWGYFACGGLGLERSLLLESDRGVMRWEHQSSGSSIEQLARIPGRIATERLQRAVACAWHNECAPNPDTPW